MRRFSELGIKQVDDKKIFNCQQVSIKSVLDQIPKDEFPFLTTIRSTKLGSSGKMYQFT